MSATLHSARTGRAIIRLETLPSTIEGIAGTKSGTISLDRTVLHIPESVIVPSTIREILGPGQGTQSLVPMDQVAPVLEILCSATS